MLSDQCSKPCMSWGWRKEGRVICGCVWSVLVWLCPFYPPCSSHPSLNFLFPALFFLHPLSLDPLLDPLLPAPGCDQRLQLGVYAALQLDSGHRGPQPQHCVQPHSLRVRAAVLSDLICQVIMHQHTYSTLHRQAQCILYAHRTQLLSFVLPLRVNIQQTLQQGCREGAGLRGTCRAATLHMTLEQQNTQFIHQSSHVIP